jgi:DNA-binding Lrp family transcriptional regulator
MVTAFVLVKATPGKEDEVFSELSKMDETSEVHTLFGEYDLIAKVEVKDYESLGELIIGRIRTLDGVKETKTMMGAERT